MSKDTNELLEKRNKRVADAVALREPDRVPFLPFFSFFPANYTGMTCQEYMYDYDKIGEAYKKTVIDFQPDQVVNPYLLFALGPSLEILDFKQLKWPGHGLPPDISYQFVEAEYMTADEYDMFLSDPTGYMLRVHFPRVCGVMEPLGLLPDLPPQVYLNVPRVVALFANPEFSSMISKLTEAGNEMQKMMTKAFQFSAELTELGFPPMYGGSAKAPFDYFGDFLRGTRGALLDMLQRPDKLKEALKKVVPILADAAISDAKRTGVPYIFMPMHKCAHNFMSLDQFKAFFWPSLRELMMTMIDAGLIPCPVWEGDCDSRLDVIKDIPKGKAVYWLERSDIFEAKKIMGDQVCLKGNVPPSLLNFGTPEEVSDYCKKLIDVVGKDGGFIMDGAIGVPDEANPKNVEVMVQTTREYGKY